MEMVSAGVGWGGRAVDCQGQWQADLSPVWRPRGVSVARASFLHCATSGKAAAVIGARVLGCGKAGRFLLAPLEARTAFPCPARLPLRDHSPTRRPTRPHSPTPDLAKRYETGWDPSSALGLRGPFSPWEAVYSRLFWWSTGTSANTAECHPAL